MNGEGQTLLGRKAGKGIIFGVIAVLLLFFLMVLSGGRSAFIIEIPYHVVCGWFLHAWKALPHLLGKWQEAVLPFGCLLIAAVIAHRFVRRWVNEKFLERRWRIRHTAGALSLLLLGSAAAIAASGVVHQFFWLAGGKVIESNMRMDLTMATSNGRQLMLALAEYENDMGRHPRSFEELELDYHPGVIRQLWWLETRDGKVPEPWILLRPGSSEVALDDEPVIVSPVIAGEGMVVVGYGDSSVRRIHADKLKEVLGQVGAEESEGGR